MKRTVFLLMLTLVWSAGSARAQETDSLFFRPDSLPTPSASGDKKGQSGVMQRRETAEPFMQTRIYFTGDFFRRFNDLTAADTGRSGRIRVLFDNEDPRLNPRQSGSKSAYVDLVARFIDETCAGPVPRVLTNPNGQLYAEVAGQATWQQQDRPFTLYLKKCQTGLNWAWELVGIDTDFLPPVAGIARLATNRPDSLVFIPPNAHELNFMGLAKQLRAGHDIRPFVHVTARKDAQLIAAAHYLASGQLQVQSLLTTTLWVNTQWGWWLQLRQFNRETDNSGWLISNLCRSGDAAGLPPLLRHFVAASPAAGSR